MFSIAKTGHLAIMLNGWNEMQAMAKLDCQERIIQLLATAPAVNIVVVSRTVGDVPPLPKAKHIEVHGLTWRGQSAVVRAELGEDGAKPLLEILAKDTPLRYAARSPLILRRLIAQAKKGTVAQASVYDLLGAAVDAFEHDAQRHLVLDSTPIDGHQRLYLEELACQLTQRQATTCSQDDAMRAFHASATRLVERKQIGSLPTLRAVLDVLASHHLLHVSDGVVRFVHQRFQEYFAANRLLRETVEHNDEPLFLRSVMNLPAWDKSVALVAGKLNGDASQVAARVRLISTAAALDLGLACDLAGPI